MAPICDQAVDVQPAKFNHAVYIWDEKYGIFIKYAPCAHKRPLFDPNATCVNYMKELQGIQTPSSIRFHESVDFRLVKATLYAVLVFPENRAIKCVTIEQNPTDQQKTCADKAVAAAIDLQEKEWDVKMDKEERQREQEIMAAEEEWREMIRGAQAELRDLAHAVRRRRYRPHIM